MVGVYHLVGGRLCVWSVRSAGSVVGQRFSRWSKFHVIDGRWSVFFDNGRWSVFYPVSGRWSMEQGRWSVVDGLWSVAGRWVVVLYYAVNKPA